MSEHRQPPLPPDTVNIGEYKKFSTEEVQAFLTQLQIFAVETGVWHAILEALDAESFFVDTRKPLSNSPQSDRLSASQGLVVTGFEESFNSAVSVVSIDEKHEELIPQTLRAWLFHLALFNHPEYLDSLFAVAEQQFSRPKYQFNRTMWFSELARQALSIHDLTLAISTADKPRLSRTAIFTQALKVGYGRRKKGLSDRLLGREGNRLGRDQARNIFVVGENPDVTGSAFFIASLAATHHLVGLPRDGFFKDRGRQAELAQETISLLMHIVQLVGRSATEREKLLDWYLHNVVGVIEAEPSAALARAHELYSVGIRTFRVYSPEPNTQLEKTVAALRAFEQQNAWEPIEVFAGQVVSVKQAKRLEAAGADALYVGVGGGGRCITGKVANLAIDWPELVWKLRGQVGVPIIVQGGGNDNPVTSIALGASGIGIVGKLAASLESPGGKLYFLDPVTQQPFVYYGGEASDRMRGMVGRVDPLGRAINTEGETTRRSLLYNELKGLYPTALQRVAEIMEALATGFVFQNAKTVAELQDKGPAHIRKESPFMSASRDTH
ncbi:IMP dehydrogenase [Candidatus Woesebacteria bacterium]|nr:IMP dehydrogenase [Candidatus Woesebacteria bacterium]